jgi:hypothetical protein
MLADPATWGEIKAMQKAKENQDRKMALLRDNLNDTANKLNAVMVYLDGDSRIVRREGKTVLMTFAKSKADFIEFAKEEDIVG